MIVFFLGLIILILVSLFVTAPLAIILITRGFRPIEWYFRWLDRFDPGEAQGFDATLNDRPEARREEMNLRPATLADADFLFRLRNDPETVRASRMQRAVTREEHEAWLVRTLGDPARALFVAEADGVAAGTGRLDLAVDHAEFSLTVAPECRGRGYGREVIAALIAEARHRGARTVVAEVRPENVFSLRAFLANGFTGPDVMLSRPTGERDVREVADELRIWSASLPAILGVPARPWNGRALTDEECRGARAALATGGPQAALEWLSENAH